MFHGGPRNALNRETLKPQNTFRTLGRLARYFGTYWPVLVGAVVMVIVSTWTQVTTPDLTGQLVDCYLAPAASGAFGSSFPGLAASGEAAQSNCWLSVDHVPHGFTQTLVRSVFQLGGFPLPPADPSRLSTADRLAGLGRFVLVIVVLFVLGALLTGLTFYAVSWTGQHVLRSLRVSVFEHLHRLPLSFYAENEAGDLMSRITNDTEALQQALSFALVNVASGVLLLGWIIYNMFTKNTIFALLSVAVAPLMLFATLWFSSQARKAFRRARQELGSINAELQETISAVREVQAFNRVEANIEQFRQINAANRDANVRAVSFTAALSPTLEALGYLALAIVTVVGGTALLRGAQLGGEAVSLGLVITFLGYVQRFNQPIQQIAVLWTNIQNGIAGAERIFNLLDIEPTIQDAPDATEMPPIRGEVEFRNVSAEYIKGQPVLKNVSFVAKPGQTIAIVGPTGAGKTTMINLIPRFYDVTEGAVLIDGIDVRRVKAESLRRQIGIVLQDTFLFSTTVMENIRVGKPDASDEEVIEAARLAHADTFIERLPEKYQTVLGERGAGLSQGQRQLLAIARAILANPRILILDEATSSVDTRTERLIQSALERLLEGRTAFVIAHRLSTIRNADMVLVVHEGEIIERGRHEELLAQKGFYYHLYMSQFRRNLALGMGKDGREQTTPQPLSASKGA
ncbi:ABC transporter ATP-binding protein [Thermanaerothrix sp. 4228-RoL]|uniref:ABC transporter ATP-binding protein n=1 Tax=Thermanaerothrix solaris TaxID=3058434 RepID=A0ABU3NM46_9CHLR|nr:ABC transporter ATP-binding protein [Thermanaerothrix sp. 4228-RoL]MDT8897430.1 ABC transporter ATP-binding protein [Thermanaerothrix sp. 4228-RoL]